MVSSKFQESAASAADLLSVIFGMKEILVASRIQNRPLPRPIKNFGGGAFSVGASAEYIVSK